MDQVDGVDVVDNEGRGTTRRRFLGGAAAAAGLAWSDVEAAVPEVTVTLDVKGLPWEELCTAEALQGLANRRGPRVYLDHGEPADRTWLDIYAERAGLRYERVESLGELVRRFRAAFKGIVLYDAAIDGSRYAAITASGTLGALPVCEVVAKRLGDLGPVKLDLRGRFTRSVDAYAWALDELMPKCSRRLAHSVDGGRVDGVLTGVCGPMSGFDWQVMNRGFVFNLGAQAKKMVSYGGEVGGDADHAAMYERILKALKPPAQINGYGDPEDYWCLLLSRHGHYSFHAYHNWSFHSKAPVRPGPIRQRATPDALSPTPDPRRYHVCFMTSEGDTMKGPLPFFYGSWFDPARGRTPINWGINPLMARLFPAMLEYYYDTATPNDGFFAGPSGAGYTYPDVMPDPAAFGRHTGQFARLADIDCLDLWGGAVPDVMSRYAGAAHPLGLTTFSSPARLRFLPDGTPVANHELGYWQTDGLNGANWATVFADDAKRDEAVTRLVRRIERIASRVSPPFVILVYGDLHSYDKHATLYTKLSAALDPARFQPARLDHAFRGIRAWARERVMVGAESVNERPAWATLQGTTTHLPLILTNGRPEPAEVTIEADGVETRTVLKARERRAVTALTVAPGEAAPTMVAALVRAAEHEINLGIPTIAVPGGDGLRSASLAGVWGSDYMVHPAGSSLADADALRGTAWLAPEPAGKYECVVCGPYSDLPKGRYVAAFRLRLAQPTALARDAAVATLDIAAGGYGAKGGRRADGEVKVGGLDPSGAWTWRLIEGDWLGSPDLMEARVWSHGKAQIAIDRVALFRVERS